MFCHKIQLAMIFLSRILYENLTLAEKPSFLDLLVLWLKISAETKFFSCYF